MYMGDMIRQYRQHKEITQKDLANELNVTPQAVSRWETGSSVPDIEVLLKLARLLHISVDELLGNQRGSDSEICEEELRNFFAEGQPMGPVLNQKQIDAIMGPMPKADQTVGQTILIVDDAPFMRMMLEKVLTEKGYTIRQAEDGRKALDILRRQNIDLCLLDIAMPGMNGLNALEEIKETYPNIKVVMISARCQECYVNAAMRLGADDFVAKPFSAEELITRLKQLPLR